MQEKAADWSSTLNLPRTDFPMKGNLAQREPEIQRFWYDHHIYEKVLAQAQKMGLPSFILHDGPPYANGHIHMGHALNKSLKDIVVRYKALRGYFTPYVHGWDTHGLPIEVQMIKELGLNRKESDPVDFRRHCREYALRYAGVQRQEIQRLGVWGLWDESYYTLKPEYEAAQIGIFGAMAAKGYIYKDLKAVYWCPTCETALAEAEIEYHDHRSPSIWVAFPVDDGKGLLPTDKPVDIVIWTTTPWTLPANLAIAVHPAASYAVVDRGERYAVVAAPLLEQVIADLGWQNATVSKEVPGRQLEGVTYRHPFMGRVSPVILGEHVTMNQGTGCVHTAPGHGLEDFVVGKKYGLPILSPVTEDGHFTAEAGPFAGLSLEEGNKAIQQWLQEHGALLRASHIDHSYPHCWRCKNPVIFRATRQWFASVAGFRQQALEAIDGVQWIPGWGRERIHNMVAERSEWCISRQRLWGLPIPAFYCRDCGEILMNPQTIEAVQRLFAREGSDAWYTHEAEEILPPQTACPKCGSRRFRKETDIMDVWFDSGSSHAAVLRHWPQLSWPADLYLEGSDQHRGWFQSSLLTSVAVYGQAPYRAVLTHGYVVDGEGRAMSKSLGNVIAPDQVIRQVGADVVRLWVTSVDYSDDVRLSDAILKQVAEVYRRLRNTFRFVLGNLYDFDPRTDRVPYEDLEEIDRWALDRLFRLVQQTQEALDRYEFHVFYHAVHNFCAVDLSAFYLDVLKDRLYVTKADGRLRRSAQTALYEIAHTLVRVIEPVLPHTAEEIWQHLPGAKEEAESVQLTFWPRLPVAYKDDDLANRWETYLSVRRAVTKALEQARGAGQIGNSLEARVVLELDEPLIKALAGKEQMLAQIFIVSQVELVQGQGGQSGAETGPQVRVERALGSKCPRCWQYAPEVGQGEGPLAGLCARCRAVVG
ncbi:MAG: isoleucine--tRNA ligase [Firmicutes bacterium]|nr:isoleucine--tRNA ligase [Bacillota bacterium]